MNRTKEFVKIVQSTNFPQRPLRNINKAILDLFDVDHMIGTELEALHSTIINNRVYETFRIQSKLEELKERIYKHRKMINMEVPSANAQEIESFNNLLNILRSRINKNTLKVNDLIRKKEEHQKISKSRRTAFVNDEPVENVDRGLKPAMDVISIEQHEEQTTNVRHRDREAITNQISEIGEIMEEIGIHVSMQEESFKRIDDLMIQTDNVFNTSISLLRKTLTNIKNVRSSIVKFFLFWLVIAILFWILRSGR